MCWSLRGGKPTLKRIVRLDLHDDGLDIQGYLSQLTSQRTVPNIFISEHCTLRHIYVIVLTPTPDLQTRSMLAVRDTLVCPL